MTAHAKPRISARTEPRGPLHWQQLVEWLSEDGVITQEVARRTIARCSQAESMQHPLVRLAAVAMARAADGKPLDIETLTQYVAGRAGLEYLRIDPLKVYVAKVADTMSAAYAERHRVLPVQVTATEVVVATAEPFVTDWVEEVERQSRRTVRRVLANPQDILRYTAEFFALAKSVRAAQKAGGNAGAASFEQLSNWAAPTSSSMPTTRAWCRWSTGCGSTPSTSARATSTWSRGASRADPLPHDGVLHPVFQMPPGWLNAMTRASSCWGAWTWWRCAGRRTAASRRATRAATSGDAPVPLPTAFGEKMVMRIFDPDTTVRISRRWASRPTTRSAGRRW